MEDLDFVVIGAGVSGLAAAKMLHELNPEQSLAVLEAAPTLGGTWAQHRLYPGLKTNNMLGTYEYPDFPMDADQFGVKPGQHIPGHVVHEYLTRYADKFGVLSKIRYNTKVLSAEHQDAGGWRLTISNGTEDATSAKTSTIIARKLIVATGLTSSPFMPHIEGQESFEAPVFHSKDLLERSRDLGATKRVTVLGGMKSGWDAAYQYATRGVEVDWVIRQSGHGPAWMAPPYVTPLKKWLEKLVNTRLLTWFSPCIWGSADGFAGIRWFWHQTAIGRAITDAFWWIIGNDVITLNKYDSHPETAKLRPWSHPMYTGTSFSIMNYDTDFFELVRSGKVKIHIADITGLGPQEVYLSNGTTLKSEALCCATGWSHTPPTKFLPEGIEKDLGIPHEPTSDDDWDSLVERADKEILTKFPRLKDPPVQNKHYIPLLETEGMSLANGTEAREEKTPYALYRFMIPPTPSMLKHRDIAFSGMLMNFSTLIGSHLQGLWIHAFFSGQLPLPDWTSAEGLDKLRYTAALHSRYGKWRYTAGYGTQVPDFVFDAVPYMDMLLGDMGIQFHRKKGRLAEALAPYGPEDYKDVVSEWLSKNES
ncbi:hypothetical protein BX600DRAFT_432600 [Xylariales sp. PMI_506]|nr:hypothetical protein BX600DRAFT_432600 [Xylariales sp. PMI_506]